MYQTCRGAQTISSVLQLLLLQWQLWRCWNLNLHHSLKYDLVLYLVQLHEHLLVYGYDITHSFCIESYKTKYKVKTYEIVRITDVTEDDRESPWRWMSSAMLTVSSWTWQWNERMLWRKLLVRGSHLTIRSHTILTRWSDILSSVFQSNSRPSGLEQFRCLHASSSFVNISASKVVTNDPNHNL